MRMTVTRIPKDGRLGALTGPQLSRVDRGWGRAGSSLELPLLVVQLPLRDLLAPSSFSCHPTLSCSDATFWLARPRF